VTFLNRSPALEINRLAILPNCADTPALVTLLLKILQVAREKGAEIIF
jgi:N-acetylglutamate synthase-like GNAT family acetyltransferase